MDISRLYPEPHPQTAGRVIDGEAVLILSETSEFNVFNALGSRIFELADGQHSLSDIIDVILSEYAVDANEARQDVIEFVNDLVHQRVLVYNTH